jgi:hypothetical protein
VGLEPCRTDRSQISAHFFFWPKRIIISLNTVHPAVTSATSLINQPAIYSPIDYHSMDSQKRRSDSMDEDKDIGGERNKKRTKTSRHGAPSSQHCPNLLVQDTQVPPVAYVSIDPSSFWPGSAISRIVCKSGTNSSSEGGGWL